MNRETIISIESNLDQEIKTGDLVTFRSATRSHCRKAVRAVTGFRWNESRMSHDVTVTRYHGWKDFVVHCDEILSVESV